MKKKYIGELEKIRLSKHRSPAAQAALSKRVLKKDIEEKRKEIKRLYEAEFIFSDENIHYDYDDFAIQIGDKKSELKQLERRLKSKSKMRKIA